MRWPWHHHSHETTFKPERTIDAQVSREEAKQAHTQSARELQRVRARRPLVEELAAKVTFELERNHFGEALLASMGRRHK